MNWYIGLDVGTTNIKAAAYCLDSGEATSVCSVPSPRVYPRRDHADYEYDADALFMASLDVLRAAVAQVPARAVRAIAVSSMAESGVLLDAHKHPLAPAITWFNPKSMPQAERLIEAVGKERIYQITGQIASSKFGVTKLMWSRDHLPQLYKKATHWLSINDYILYRLSGRLVTDYSIAARTMAFDIRALDWSGELLGAAGIPASLLPRPVPGGTAVGGLLPGIAASLGISNVPMVVTGGHDHACAAVGTGAITSGVMLDSMGTSEVTILPIPEAKTTHEMFEAQCSVCPHCGPEPYRVLTSMQACGASIEWFLRTLGKAFSADAEARGTDVYSYMNAVAAECEESGLLYYPFLRGSLRCPDAGGIFLPIHDSHDVRHFCKAVLDGLCCEFTFQLHDSLSSLCPEAAVVYAVGGPSKSAYLMQRKADVSGLRVEVPLRQEAAVFGAALLSAAGCGDRSFEELQSLAHAQTYHSFSPAPTAASAGISGVYARLRNQLETLSITK